MYFKGQKSHTFGTYGLFSVLRQSHAFGSFGAFRWLHVLGTFCVFGMLRQLHVFAAFGAFGILRRLHTFATFGIFGAYAVVQNLIFSFTFFELSPNAFINMSFVREFTWLRSFLNAKSNSCFKLFTCLAK